MTTTASPAGAEPLAPPGRGPLLAWIALPLVAGAACPQALATVGVAADPAWAWWLAGAPLALLAVALHRLPWACRFLTLAASALLGMHLAAVPDPDLPPPAGRLAAIRGEVVWSDAGSWSQRLGIAVEQPADGSWSTPRTITVRAPTQPSAAPGDIVVARGALTAGERGWRLEAVDLVIAVPRNEGARGFAFRALERHGGRQELADALILGRGDPPEREVFRAAGLLHILAVSGAHLMIAAGMTAWLLLACGVPWAFRLALLVAVVGGYAWLTGGAPATVRALAMVLAVAAMTGLSRRPHPLAALSLAALTLVACNPAMARDVGFQLSFAAVAGICTLGLDLVRLRARLLPLQPWQLDRPTWRVLLWVCRGLIDGACIGIAAGLATAPLLALMGAAVAPWGWVATLAAAPACTVALWAGLPLTILGGCWPDGPWEGLHAILAWSLDAMVAAAELGSLPPLAAARVAPPPTLLLLIFPLFFLPLRSLPQLAARAAALAVAVWWWSAA